MSTRGKVFVLSGPSGSGKHTILKELLKRDEHLVLSVSATTRPARPGEIDGKDYYFLDREDFLRRVEKGEFVEWADVHGHLYGTLRSELARRMESGKDVLLQVDIQGMRSLQKSGLGAVTIFVVPPSLDELKRRLDTRGTESDEDLAVRLANARRELEAQDDYDYIVVNDVLEDAVNRTAGVIREVRNREEHKQTAATSGVRQKE